MEAVPPIAAARASGYIFPPPAQVSCCATSWFDRSVPNGCQHKVGLQKLVCLLIALAERIVERFVHLQTAAEIDNVGVGYAEKFVTGVRVRRSGRTR